MSVTLGNPVVVTSGTLNTLIANDNIKVKNLYWFQPDLSSTSTLIISKKDESGITFAEMKAETSGETQIFMVDGDWWHKPFIRCVPCGKLYIYTE